MTDWIEPNWPAPLAVRAVFTTRAGGVSRGPYTSMNLGAHVGDDPRSVEVNRHRLRGALDLPAGPYWLNQVHGARVVAAGAGSETPVEADAATTDASGVVCAVMTADCLPVLFCDRAGQRVAAAHAGWRGLGAGVLETTVASMRVPEGEILAWLGPAIGPGNFEVGEAVVRVFVDAEPAAETAFRAVSGVRWKADIYALARHRLRRAGVREIYGGDWCTFSDPGRFFSYRRDGTTGRMAALIWMQGTH